MPRITLPPGTRGLFGAVMILSALNATLRFRKWTASLETSPTTAITTPSNYLSDPKWANPFLVLVPTTSLRYPWTALTAALVENNIVSLAISAAVIWFGGKYLERAWGGKEFGKFVACVVLIPNISTFCIYALWHMLAPKPEFPTPIQGLVALEAGFLVALKQLVPEHTVSLFRGAVRVRIKHFPAIFAFANILSGPLFGTDTALWLSLIGFMTAWIYLRFFRITEISSVSSGGEGMTVRGDASDIFAFVAFFPDALQPVLTPICDSVYAVLVQLRLIIPFSEEAIEADNERVQGRAGGLPTFNRGLTGSGGGRRAEAERRRAIALRALDQRLNVAATSRASSTTDEPSIADDSDKPGLEAGGAANASQTRTTPEP